MLYICIILLAVHFHMSAHGTLKLTDDFWARRKFFSSQDRPQQDCQAHQRLYAQGKQNLLKVNSQLVQNQI